MNRFFTLLFTLLSGAVSFIPLVLTLFIARCVAWVWFYMLPIRRKVAIQNINRVYGDTLTPSQKRTIVRQSMENLAMSAMEVLRAPAFTQSFSDSQVEQGGLKHLNNALEEGRGVIAVMIHLGNIDYCGFVGATSGFPVHAIVKKMGWQPAQNFIERIRLQTGLQFISSKRSKERIVEVLNNGEIIGMAIDQHLPAHRAIVVDFFGQAAATTPAPARFAYETGAVIIPVRCRRVGLQGHHRIEYCKPFVLDSPFTSKEKNIRHNTQRLSVMTEEWIRDHPEQWLWLHKRWKVEDSSQTSERLGT